MNSQFSGESQSVLFLQGFQRGQDRLGHADAKLSGRDKVTLKSRGINWSSTREFARTIILGTGLLQLNGLPAALPSRKNGADVN